MTMACHGRAKNLRRPRINLYAEAVRIFGTDDLFSWGNDAMNDNQRTCNRLSDHERGIPHGCPDDPAIWTDWIAFRMPRRHTISGPSLESMARAQAADDTDPFPAEFDDAARERNREFDEIASEAGATDENAYTEDAPWDAIRGAIGLRVFARILVDAHAAATARGASLREAQRRTGHAIDTRADYAEGSAAAYSFALSALEGATGTPRATLVGEGWSPPSGMAPPVLPEGVTVDDNRPTWPDGSEYEDTDERAP